MKKKKNRQPRCLFINHQELCQRILDENTRLEYIYRYTEETSRRRFINYAVRHNRPREDAEDIFMESVIIIYNKIGKGEVILKCGAFKSDCTEFIKYFWMIMHNLLMDIF